MTAIAILNVENDPHMVADTLLSAKGNDPRESKTVWLPALGLIPSEWTSGTSTWHISRLGRKTFLLPNQSGILGFSGDCSSAFQFWDGLSDRYITAATYDESRRIDAKMVEQVLHGMPKEAAQFSLLGIFIDANGNRTPFVHNQHTKIKTNNFGSCYICGSGTEMIVDIIMRMDKQLSASHGWPINYPISPTEDLAENISAFMLYKESDHENGKKPNTPISSSCGGFYEWYRIQMDGIRPMRPRVDLHITVENNRMTVTRAYFSEQMQLRQLESDASPVQRYYLSVLSLITSPLLINFADVNSDGYALKLDECWGVLISSTFEKYASQTSNNNPDQIFARLDKNILLELFPASHKVARVRVVAGEGVSDRVVKRFIPRTGELENAIISMEGNMLILHLSPNVILNTLKTFL